MPARRRRTLASLVLVSALATLTAAPAHGASYKVTISGKQELTWKVDGTTSGCEVRRGAGSGSVRFSFRDRGAAPAGALARGRGMYFATSIPSKATGTISGAFTDSSATPCPQFAPGDPVIDPTGGCGAETFGVRVDFQYRDDGFIYVTGPQVPLGPVSLAALGGECPFPLGGGFDSSSDRAACGDGSQLWKRSWGVAYSGGQGLFASRIAVKPKTLLRPKGKTVVLTGSAKVDCTIPSQYSGGIKLTGKLTYTLTARKYG